MFAFFASTLGFVSRSGPIFPVEPATVKAWQLPQPLSRKMAFPFTAFSAAEGEVVVFAVVAFAVVIFAVVVFALEAATVCVTVRVPPAVEWPIAQPTTPAGTSSAKKSNQMTISAAVVCGSLPATTESYASARALSDTRTRVRRAQDAELQAEPIFGTPQATNKRAEQCPHGQIEEGEGHAADPPSPRRTQGDTNFGALHDHYNRERSHRALELRPPEGDERREGSPVGEIRRRDCLSGLIHEYYRAA
jgi:hypothetical protein